MLIENTFSFIIIFIFYVSNVNTLIEVTYEEPKQTCTYFYDNRFAEPTHGLVNCSWYAQKACCKRTEVNSVFSKMYPLYEASKTCANMMNYLMCFFCSPEQHIWYKTKAKVCSEFCTVLFEECKMASYNGERIGSKYENGSVFCEGQDFIVADSNCFKFDPKVFDGAVQHYLPVLSSIIMVIIVLML